jgi:hypothetical protein
VRQQCAKDPRIDQQNHGEQAQAAEGHGGGKNNDARNSGRQRPPTKYRGDEGNGKSANNQDRADGRNEMDGEHALGQPSVPGDTERDPRILQGYCRTSVSSIRNAIACHRLIATSILAFLGVTSWACCGWACSCGGTWERTDADVIFQGEAIEVHQPLHLRFKPSRVHGLARVPWGLWFEASRALDQDVRTVFCVSKAWKGSPSQFVTVNTGSGLCCDCSVGKIFEEGKQYVVYGAQYNGQLNIGLCGGSALPRSGLPRAEVEKLGRGTPPSSGRRPRGLPMFWRHLLLPGAVALALRLAAIIWRRATHRYRGAKLGLRAP